MSLIPEATQKNLCFFLILYNSPWPPQELHLINSMEKDKKKHTDMKPFLLKLVIPAALSLAGLIISTLAIGSRRMQRRKLLTDTSSEEEEGPMCNSPRCISDYEFEGEDSSLCPDQSSLTHNSNELGDEGRSLDSAFFNRSEEEEHIGEPSCILDEEEGEIREPSMTLQSLESTRERSLKQLDYGTYVGEMEGMKSLVSSLQNRECELEAQFYDHCNMQQQESTFQKLQIVCLGLKLESLECQNQRLEGRAMEFEGAIEKLDSMRREVESLRKKLKKLSKANRESKRIVREESLALQAREVEIIRGHEVLRLGIEEVREVADKLHEERRRLGARKLMDPSTSKSEEEMTVGVCYMSRSSDDKLLDQLAELRIAWSQEIEELIYLGWINLCLRNELLSIQQEEEEEGLKTAEKIGEQPMSNEVVEEEEGLMLAEKMGEQLARNQVVEEQEEEEGVEEASKLAERVGDQLMSNQEEEEEEEERQEALREIRDQLLSNQVVEEQEEGVEEASKLAERVGDQLMSNQEEEEEEEEETQEVLREIRDQLLSNQVGEEEEEEENEFPQMHGKLAQLMSNQEEEEEDEGGGKISHHLVMENLANEQARNVSLGFYDLKQSMAPKKPRLLHKLKGWAKGKGRCKKRNNLDSLIQGRLSGSS